MKLNNSNNMIRRFAVAALMALTGAMAASAESLPIHVSIPFAFTVKGTVMPAGEYSVKPLDGFASAVVLHNMEGKANMIALANPDYNSKAAPAFVFTTADAGKALTSISAPGWTVTFSVPAPLKVAGRVEVPGVIAALASAR